MGIDFFIAKWQIENIRDNEFGILTHIAFHCLRFIQKSTANLRCYVIDEDYSLDILLLLGQ